MSKGEAMLAGWTLFALLMALIAAAGPMSAGRAVGSASSASGSVGAPDIAR